MAETRHYTRLANPLTEEQATFRPYGLVTLLEDAADTLATDEATTLYTLNQVIAQLGELVFAAHQHPLPRIKDRLATLCEVDATVGRGVQQDYRLANTAQKHELAKALVLPVTGHGEFFE